VEEASFEAGGAREIVEDGKGTTKQTHSNMECYYFRKPRHMVSICYKK